MPMVRGLCDEAPVFALVLDLEPECEARLEESLFSSLRVFLILILPPKFVELVLIKKSLEALCKELLEVLSLGKGIVLGFKKGCSERRKFGRLNVYKACE